MRYYVMFGIMRDSYIPIHLGWPSTKETSLSFISKEIFWLVSSTKLPFFEYVGPKPLNLSHQYLK